MPSLYCSHYFSWPGLFVLQDEMFSFWSSIQYEINVRLENLSFPLPQTVLSCAFTFSNSLYCGMPLGSRF